MKKVIIIIVIIALGFFSWKIYQRYSDKHEVNNQRITEEKVDLGFLEKIYKKEVKVVLNNYLRQAQEPSLITKPFVNQTKNSLLALMMPVQFKELHLNLVLAMDRMIEYLDSNNENQLEESQKIIKQAKEDYEWLN